MVPPGVVQCNVAMLLIILSVLIPKSMQDKQTVQVKTELVMLIEPPGNISNMNFDNSKALLCRNFRFSNLNELLAQIRSIWIG